MRNKTLSWLSIFINPLNSHCHIFHISIESTGNTNLSIEMATKVKTEAETDTPCTKPLILHTVLEKGQPVGNTNDTNDSKNAT